MHEHRRLFLTADEADTKYRNGSPDYPGHNCGGCSGCYASWVELRGGRKGAVAGIQRGRALALTEAVAELRRVAHTKNTGEGDWIWGQAADQIEKLLSPKRQDKE